MKRPDGTIIVEHTDGTRITTFYVNESSKTDGETGEQSTSQHGPVKHYKVGTCLEQLGLKNTN